MKICGRTTRRTPFVSTASIELGNLDVSILSNRRKYKDEKAADLTILQNGRIDKYLPQTRQDP